MASSCIQIPHVIIYCCSLWLHRVAYCALIQYRLVFCSIIQSPLWVICMCNCSNTWVQFPHGIRAFVDLFLSFHIFIAVSTSLTGSILLTKGTISDLLINLRISSWLHLISLNGKQRWRYFWERKVSTEWLWQQKYNPMQLQIKLNGTTGGMRPMVFYVWAFQETSSSILMDWHHIMNCGRR